MYRLRVSMRYKPSFARKMSQSLKFFKNENRIWNVQGEIENGNSSGRSFSMVAFAVC